MLKNQSLALLILGFSMGTHTAIFKFGRLFNMLKIVSLSKINH